MLKKKILPNGICLVGEELPHYHSVSVGVWVACGSAYENEGNNGISHFLEHLLFKGTENRDATQIVKEVEEVGGSIDGFTSREVSGYWIKIPSAHLEKAIEILADLLLHPRFSKEDFLREKEVVIEEIRGSKDSPQEFLSDAFTQNFWDSSPWGYPILGKEENIAKITLEEVKDFYRRLYFSSPFIISLAGNFSFSEAERIVSSKFQVLSWGERDDPPEVPVVRRKLVAFYRPLEQVHFVIGTPGISQKSKDKFAFLVLESLLGGGMSSRLFQKLREERGLVYEVFTFHLSTSRCGFLGIYGGTKGDKTKDTVQLVLEELRKIKKGEISEEEVERNKEFLKGGILLSLENTQSRMSRLASHQFYYGRLFSVEEVIKRIEKVTLEDVRSIAGKILDDTFLNIAFLGDEKVVKELEKEEWRL
ncbi:MAG TPA: insulinase family protein [bacterium]|nr:insulinase family protein [bacterium]HEX68201.1 insulinase family protein [bacterium]